MQLQIAQTASIKAALVGKKKKKYHLRNEDLLSSGCDVMNLGITGRTTGAFPKGKYIILIGDTRTGKTFLVLTCFAEALLNPNFKDYRIIFDDPEDGAMMDKVRYFGNEVAKRIEPPFGTRKKPKFSRFVEDFYGRLDDLCDEVEKGDSKPFIYVLDSENALDSRPDYKKFRENKNRNKKDQEGKGSFGTKPKIHSENIKRIRGRLRDTKSILIIICQTRQRIGYGSNFDPKTRAGGDAILFFADVELWTSLRGRITKDIMGKTYKKGIYSLVKVKKNRINGKERDFVIVIDNDIGIDNTGTSIEFLINTGYWTTSGQTEKAKKVNATEFGQSMKRDKLIEWIEAHNKEAKLKALVKQVWKQIEKDLKSKRKKRYQ